MLCFKKIICFLGSVPELNYAFLIDDVDYLDPLMLDDWLPSVLPKNVHFIFTCDANSKFLQAITTTTTNRCHNNNTCLIIYPIPQLNANECRAIILNHLNNYGVCCVHSQLEYEISELISTCESNNPLYFNIVCKYLKLCRTHDEVKSLMKKLSGSTIHQLIDQMIMKNVEVEVEELYNKDLIIATFGFLTFYRYSLSTKELFMLLNQWLLITQNINEKSSIVSSWETTNAWKMLSTIQTKPNDLESICKLDRNIDKFILSTFSNSVYADNDDDDDGDDVHKYAQLHHHLTPFAFCLLLKRLQPLLIFFNNTPNNNNNNNNNNVMLTKEMTFKHKIELWNLTAKNVSFQNCCSMKQLILNKFLKNHENYMYSEYALNVTIHKILAIVMPDLDDKLYHFLYADELDIICHLLTSPIFIYRILKEHPVTLMKFLNGNPTTDQFLLEKWKTKLKSCLFSDKIDAMKKFICMNYEFLVKYPNSFCELAINQDSSQWIHNLGVSLLYDTDFHVQRQLNINNNNNQLLFRLNSPKCTLIKPMQANTIYKPIVTLNGSMDVPTSVEMNATAKILVYGTRCGTITFVELSSMHELWSLTGHHSSVESLCFLDEFPSKSENKKSSKNVTSQLWLLSGSEDGDIFIWDVSTMIHNVESKMDHKAGVSQLASLCGYHRRCVTTSAWHPRRQLIATGDLDCLVYLWNVSEISLEPKQQSKSICSVELHPYKLINVSSYPVISVSFRLPSLLNNKQEDLIHDDLAIGCWDGTIHFYNLSSLSIVRSLSASTSLCSLAYSPNGGNILATFDRNGELMLWNNDILWYQCGVIQTNPCIDYDYFPFDQSDELMPNCNGKICFSKPNGQYIFQSGGGQFLNYYINIWDTGLWATFGPWNDVKLPEMNSRNSVYVTCVTILPTSEHVLIGWSNGDLTVVYVYNGRLLHYLKAPTEDNSSIQCITSMCVRSYQRLDTYNVVVGNSSGAVRIYLCILKPKISPYEGRYIYQSGNAMSELHFQLIDTLWSHSMNHNINDGVTEKNGGTLCSASVFSV
ncbi:unnamed protein product, partial [Schistosoma turkestanicum]